MQEFFTLQMDVENINTHNILWESDVLEINRHYFCNQHPKISKKQVFDFIQQICLRVVWCFLDLWPLQKATCVLMELLLGSGLTGVMVSTQLDVTSQQHLFLLGQNGVNFLTVMHQTHTQIILPDLSAPQHTPSLLIQGTADGVCVARQQLMVQTCVCALTKNFMSAILVYSVHHLFQVQLKLFQVGYKN